MSLTFGSSNILKELGIDEHSDCLNYSQHFKVNYKIHPNKKNSLHKYENGKHIILLLGSVFEKIKSEISVAEYVYQQFIRKGPESIYEIDGNFVFIVYNKQAKSFTVFSERFGVIPVYYYQKNNEILFSTSLSILFTKLSYDDIDLHSVRDLMRHGTLVGNATMSKQVKMLEGGSRLTYKEGKIDIKKMFLFHYDEDNAEHNQSKLIEEVAETYFEAVHKRFKPVMDNACLLLSGGLDSRLLLATINRLFPEKISCVSMGQPFSEETSIARWSAALYDNPFDYFELHPDDFVNNSTEFIRLSGGSDSFMQSYSLAIARQLSFSTYATGFILDVFLGGTFLNEQSIKNKDSLFSFFHKNERVFKMHLFSDEEFGLICKPDSKLPRSSKYIEKSLHEYDSWKLNEVIQPFGVRSRDLKLVLGRDLVFDSFMDACFPSVDKNFLTAIAKIPAKERLDHKFYRELFMSIFPEYCDIPYNNTTLPVSAPLEEWKEGAKREAEREKIYSTMQIANLKMNKSNAPYYPHFYSDFVGYSRIDPSWKQLISDMLLSEQTLITKEWFNKQYIEKLLNEHLSGLQNHRKKIVQLASLEIFVRQTR